MAARATPAAEPPVQVWPVPDQPGTVLLTAPVVVRDQVAGVLLLLGPGAGGGLDKTPWRGWRGSRAWNWPATGRPPARRLAPEHGRRPALRRRW